MATFALADLKLAAARLEEAASAGSQPILQETLGAQPWLVRVVRVEVGARFLHLASVPTMALVLAGVGTLEVEDWRATVLPGQLVSVLAGQQVALRADGEDAMVAALVEQEPVAEPQDAPVDVT
jgi:quercetin dioxygenase-like cupin family protein